MTVPTSSPHRAPWAWVPTLYLAQGLPFAVVNSVSVILYKNLGVSNADIAFYTGWLYLPWVIKPLWSPVVDLLRTRRWWIWVGQLLMGAAFAGVGLTLPLAGYFQISLILFYLVAFASATHDIAADGFYLLALTEKEQSFFVGIRSTCFRLALIFGQGLLVLLAGWLQNSPIETEPIGSASSTSFAFEIGTVRFAWAISFTILAVFLSLLGLYHRFMLPRPDRDIRGTIQDWSRLRRDFSLTFRTFFQKPEVGRLLAFLLLYRFAEAQLVKLASPFLLETRATGGLGLTTQDVGFVYGTVGTIALTLGGVLGGFAIARKGLRAWLWPMAAAIQAPNAVYVYLAYARPESLSLVNTCVALEQFGYGFGFAAYLMVMIYLARGAHQTAHYALCTGFMALGMMLPGMVSGQRQEALGYQHFFTWIMLATIPGFVVTALLRIEPDFGRKN